MEPDSFYANRDGARTEHPEFRRGVVAAMFALWESGETYCQEQLRNFFLITKDEWKTYYDEVFIRRKTDAAKTK